MSDDTCKFTGKVYLASDHAGLSLKEFIQNKLSARGCIVIDLGPHELVPDDDYPDIIRPAAEHVGKEKGTRAVIIGGSGQGEAMVANRVKGARAIVFYGGDLEIIKTAREHNDANVLSLGARLIEPEEAWQAVNKFLSVPFPGETRHERRIKKIDA